MMKIKFLAAVLVLSTVAVAQTPAAPAKPTVQQKAPAPTKPIPIVNPTVPAGGITLTEVETLKLQNLILQYNVVKLQADQATALSTTKQTEAMAFIAVLEQKYNAKFDSSTGAFTALPKK